MNTFALHVSAEEGEVTSRMQIHVWLQLIMLVSGYLKLFPEETGLTVAFPQVATGLWKYGVLWDLVTAILLWLHIYNVSFQMIYVYLGVILGITLEPNRMYDSSVVQVLPALLLVREIRLYFLFA